MVGAGVLKVQAGGKYLFLPIQGLLVLYFSRPSIYEPLRIGKINWDKRRVRTSS